MKVASVLADPAYSTLKQYILERTALQYYSEKDEDLATRIGRRMRSREVHDCAAYLQLLRKDVGTESEWDALVGEITIGETYFFRQSEHFDLLRATVIPDILRRNFATRTLRIWSAGCATGAEPYSLSLLLHREFADQLQGWDVKILATDINVQFLAQARTARFGEWALRNTPSAIRDCCFRRSGPMWELAAQYRRFVDFEHHNLASEDPFPGTDGFPMDLILCRNVMIYFSEQRIRQLAQRFYDCLPHGGWLLVGHAEPSMLNFPQFEVMTTELTTAYRKGAVQPAPVVVPQPDFNAWPFVAEPARQPAPGHTPRTPLPSALPPPSRQALPDTESRVEIAMVHADQGNWESAGEVCRKLLAEDPLNAAVHFVLGLVAEHTATPADAAAAFRRAVYLDSRFVLAHYHLGLTLHASGNRSQAKKSFRNTIELLSHIDGEEQLPHGDGICGAELRELAEMHLEIES